MPFVDAERTQLYLRCALFGPSGSGKTMTGLRIAKGISEKMGVPFAVIDSEARRASKYSGIGGFAFKVENLKEKTIDHYLKAMEEAKEAGYKVLLIDSLTHAWRELNEEVDRISLRNYNKNTFSPWAKVGPKQKKLIEAILNYPGHLITTMRSKTEWVIGEGKDGKIAPQRIGLAPEQGKGIEYEFDVLIELNQNHEGTILKSFPRIFQDAVIEWLENGIPDTQSATPTVAENTPAKLENTPNIENPKPENQNAEVKGQNLKKQGDELMKEIGTIITTANGDEPYFTEEEKEGARQIIKATKPDEKGIADLMDFKAFLSEELSKRETNKAA